MINAAKYSDRVSSVSIASTLRAGRLRVLVLILGRSAEILSFYKALHIASCSVDIWDCCARGKQPVFLADHALHLVPSMTSDE